ncbi:hypothetical protein [Phenylobacterium deserti]|uniref:Chemotaxis protein CheE n=1 Tax=Phenylobacterium deserti TaxID=1914756 RepID=A0A328ATZ9_9CAUL|nr:hypothetical protein [Phenylobacterium deserti]RAK57166.1 hypothetical protein DJ018_04220 [Phenylobacterium deserti]
MTKANVFKYENRLAKSLVTKGGMTASEAIRTATAAVEQVRQPTLNEIDATLREIYELGERLRAGADPEALRAMYAAGNRVVAMAGVFGLAELGQAAYSLCELISRLQTSERHNWRMIEVHLDGLRLLRAPDEHSPEHRQAVLAGLRQVATSIG